MKWYRVSWSEQVGKFWYRRIQVVYSEMDVRPLRDALPRILAHFHQRPASHLVLLVDE